MGGFSRESSSGIARFWSGHSLGGGISQPIGTLKFDAAKSTRLRSIVHFDLDATLRRINVARLNA